MAASIATRVKVACRLLLDLRVHDLRAARTFMATMYPDEPPAGRLLHFAGWVAGQVLAAIPTAMRRARFRRPVSRVPIWLADGNPLADHPWRERPDARLPELVETVVIGAGFTGAGCAYHWSKRDAGRMAILEMGDPASGASGRNEGLVVMGRYFAMVRDTVRPYLDEVRPNLSSGDREQLARQFAAVYARGAYKNADLIEQTIKREEYQCDYARRGWIQAREEADQTALEESVRAGREAGFEDWCALGPDEVRELGGMKVDHPAGFSRAAASFHPARWVWSLLRTALQKPNIELFTRTRVEEVVDEGECYLLKTNRGELRARFVINATESYTGLLHRHYRELIFPVQTQAAFGLGGPENVRAGIGLSGKRGFFSRHCSAEGDGVLFGSDATRLPHRLAGNNRPSRFISKFLLGEMARYFGGAEIEVTNEWSGTPGFTTDEFPVVGRLDGKRQYIIGGMCGSGTAVSFNGARHVVEKQVLGLEGPDDYPESYYAPTRILDPANHPWPEIDGPAVE